MGSANELVQIRQAFKIPESVVIRVLPITKILQTPIGQPKNNFQVSQVDNTDPELYRSLLGTPVYTNIEFLPESYETRTKGQFRDTPRLRYEAVLLSVTQAKKIIKTEIQGRDGTVKEYIGMDDYMVQISGIITGANGHFPIDEVALLRQVVEAPVPIPVASTYLNNLGINLLVVEDAEFSQEEGGYSFQRFTLNCSSDVPQELRLSNV